MSSTSKKIVFAAGVVFVLASGLFFTVNQESAEVSAPPAVPTDVLTPPTFVPTRIPETISKRRMVAGPPAAIGGGTLWHRLVFEGVADIGGTLVGAPPLPSPGSGSHVHSRGRQIGGS